MLNYQTSELFIYPVKSAGRVKIDKLEPVQRGLPFDRHWMLVHPDGKMITQREFPKLNTIQCTDEGESFRFYFLDNAFPAISFKKTGELIRNITISLWRDTFNAYITQIILGEWFSEFLSTKIQVVTYPERIKKLNNLPDERIMNFQDSSPIHLINISSITELSKQAEIDIDPSQFRANIYLDLETAFAEDDINEIMINGVQFTVIKPCERCIMITIRPNDAMINKEPLRTLSKLRSKVNFGIYLAPKNFNN
jgi:uncharacterized protein YcbX